MNRDDGWRRHSGNLIRLSWFLAVVALLASMSAGVARAQVPANIEAQLLKMGHIVDPGCTAKLYRPLMPPKDIVDQFAEMQKTGKPSNEVPIYRGVAIYRDMSFGPNPKDVVDIFTTDKGPASRPVLIYVPGGVGNKIELQDREANAFNDNIARWATQNGMVGVLMQRHGALPGAGQDYYAGAKDVSAMIQYLEANVSKYHGNPDSMFIWAQSAGNGPLGIYAGHPELYGPKGIGVKGIVFMSGQFSILRPDDSNPVPQPENPGAVVNALSAAGATCGLKGGAFSVEGVLPGRTPDQPGGQAAMPGGFRGFPPGPKLPEDELIQRSSLPGLEKTDAKILVASAELDPGVDGKMSAFNQALHDELCKVDGPNAADGKGHCPAMLFEKGESHMSEIFSVDTSDKTVSGPILVWIGSIK